MRDLINIAESSENTFLLDIWYTVYIACDINAVTFC